MNAAQVQGMRDRYGDWKSITRRKMSAREMAETSHKLSRDGNMAETDDGHTYVWDARFDHWAMWK